MGRNLSPALRQELANLEKDSDSRRSAMKALKLHVKDMDSKAIPLFLAQVSETKESGCSPGEYTISIYEVLARLHGPNILPQLDDIMSSIIKTLTTSGGSFPLQQACSKVVPAIGRYMIEPTTQLEKKKTIIRSLCKPLSDSLLGTQESLSCGAALCLKALVDSDDWRFASDELVNEVCLKLASAMEDKATQTNSHMGLLMSLAKHNSHIVEAYAGLLIRAALNILNDGLSKNSQKRLTAIQMVHSLMKCLDIRSIFSERDSIIEAMEKCQSDQMPYVRGAAFEAMQTAKRLLVEELSKISCDEDSVTGSNFSRSSNSVRRNFSSSGSQSPESVSPESKALDLFSESFMDSSISMTQSSCNTRKKVNKKQWNQENGFSKDASENYRSRASTEQDEGSDNRSYSDAFPGSIPCSMENGVSRNRPRSLANGAVRRRPQTPANGALRTRPQSPMDGAMRSQTPSPQRTRSQIDVDNIKIFSTPRKLVCSLQDHDENSNYDNQSRRRGSSYTSNRDWRPIANYDDNGCLNNHRSKNGFEDNLCGSTSESVLSTENVLAIANGNVSPKMLDRGQIQSIKTVKASGRKISTLVLFIFLLITLGLASVLLIGEQDENRNLVPT
ncbi:protein SINE1-like [Amaranthus tricolor]|uniref:protein SINE1-like n=1 Tax=Amaranthus tricolor TaxID=29722 RepID=UPI00258E3C8A|nr:protein SINE1-like [Amaranthus tricolor]